MLTLNIMFTDILYSVFVCFSAFFELVKYPGDISLMIFSILMDLAGS